jgi:16S rRNA (cytosine1402-N4)-methyltransferase
LFLDHCSLITDIMTIHKTVLLNEAIESLNLKQGMVAIDATLGGGGHASKVLEKIGEGGKLIAFDLDIDAINRFKKKIEASGSGRLDKNIILLHDNFSALKDRLVSLRVSSVDAILADLGISSDQLQDKERGISFQTDAPLDMRMDRTRGNTAADILNTYSEQQLTKILKEFSNEQYAHTIARNIVSERNKNQITRTLQLVEIIGRSVPGAYKRKKIHYATKTFQALRIEVNRELESLNSFLSQAVEVLKPGGRLAIITFHSGEDALVKYTLRENARGCICPPEFPVCQCGKKPFIRLITHKPIVPSSGEIEGNPRARSAKLRVIEKI